ncbi:hypothetical protein DL93DRAFT_2103073 [Clavulina sp. PMI_390]|nr:hypothetical protein DL93DRAFT_2103073 [Clavulina sp. PMI_390]
MSDFTESAIDNDSTWQIIICQDWRRLATSKPDARNTHLMRPVTKDHKSLHYIYTPQRRNAGNVTPAADLSQNVRLRKIIEPLFSLSFYSPEMWHTCLLFSFFTSIGTFALSAVAFAIAGAFIPTPISCVNTDFPIHTACGMRFVVCAILLLIAIISLVVFFTSGIIMTTTTDPRHSCSSIDCEVERGDTVALQVIQQQPFVDPSASDTYAPVVMNEDEDEIPQAWWYRKYATIMIVGSPSIKNVSRHDMASTEHLSGIASCDLHEVLRQLQQFADEQPHDNTDLAF